MKTLSLDKPSAFYRSTVARGIAAKDEKAGEKAIDRSGGKYGAGLIRGFSMIARGEALGHGMWIDAEMLSQVAAATNAAENGIKSRFTHPSLSGDGLGKMSARAFSSVIDGNLVRADAHFLESAHGAPDGDLASYIMDLAEEDPAAFGASISFRRDLAAEQKLLAEHGAKKVSGEDGYDYFDGVNAWDLSEFKSPDPDNVNNLPHARLKSLRAVDFVDSPAANPSGIFHSDPFAMLEGGEAVLDYVFGVTDQAPETEFGIDASRLKGFVHRWAESRKFEICTSKSKEPDMSVIAPAAPAATETEKPAELSTANPPVVAPAIAPVITEASSTPAVPPVAPVAQPVDNSKLLGDAKNAGFNDAKTQLATYTKLFGAEKGSKWFCEGKPLDECRDLHIADLTADNKDKDAKLAAATTGLGLDAPLSGTATDGKAEAAGKYDQVVGRNLGKVAAAYEAQMSRIPTPSTN